MGSFKIQFKRSAEKEIRRIERKLIPRILTRIEALADNPFPRQSLKLSEAEATYRLRTGNYRVIYGVDTVTKTIIVHYIRHRKEAYRKL
jgi:mRNA interferase RelE/StbE